MEAPDRDYERVRRAIEFLSENRLDQPELAELAGVMGLSPTQCQRLFKRWCGLSPKSFLQAITVDHARQLLEGSASLLDASLEVGLSGPGRLHDLFVEHEAMTPGDYKRRGDGLLIRYGYAPSPFGECLVMATERGLCGLAFCDEAAGEGAGPNGRVAAFEDMARRWPAARFLEDASMASAAASEVFGCAGEGREATVRIVLIGTDFEIRVWETLLRIPIGRAVTYSDIAAHVGQPTASRAVGSAVGRNPISFVVPCHRVLRRDGGLGGYHWGVTRKRALIGWERGRLEPA
ncbi:MAG: methylated-DNA--[protein]-cysteine S-methyltransferase [Rhizobiales bacterium]|nr:methylated-DNA--[protein]-cysteine S-methyltransferase [Hyphomicrobiales bacterium]